MIWRVLSCLRAALHVSRWDAPNSSLLLRVRKPMEEIMLAPELAALVAVMSFALLFVCAALVSAHLALTTRAENVARTIGARMLG